MIASLLLSLCCWAAIPQDQNPMDLNPEIREFLDKRVDRGQPELERLQALVNTIFRGRALNFTYAPMTRTVIETYTERSGNCLSFSFMFISMARYLGLNAKFREVNIAPVWTKVGDFLVLSEHVNAAVLIGNQVYAIDIFPEVNRIEIGGQVVSDERGLAHFYNNKGVDELIRGNAQNGEASLQKALQIDPTALNAWINLGAAKMQSNELQAAEKYLSKALELDPHDPAVMNNLATVCQRMGRLREATHYRTKIKKFREKNPYYHFDLGVRSYDNGQYEEAIRHYRRALKLKSKEHRFYYALARAYKILGQQSQAEINLKLAEKYASDAANRQHYAEKLDLLRGIQPQ
jgi:tetratricopeptide (TPR) repeat protein